ncbi:RagB/SusD family nutrient uptake outer membrane protein [Sphingobacterium yanglingense]|uniref:Putative outer membrane starch-binding protein n=1 Tax=Sphingobacterium yanglingense TaxID=1437280 RepID=A0A4R6WI95_9SPHI|nr:RagB/SusD family nutrient uptake outer membrane protein [Sphingobacterium yanglingense]TDQ77286.1 putative outer membrane starch-binding protein [Sphingobacterium yanglingense]
MKIRRHILSLSTLALALALSSCQKDFLDRKPLNLLSEEVVWKDPELIKLSVNEFYTFLKTGFDTYIPAAKTDDIQLVGNEEKKITSFLTGDFLSTSFPERNLWKDSYAQIRKLNVFINRAAVSTVLNDTERKVLLGQARFMRAYVYFNLFTSFKDAPLLLKHQSIEEAEDKPTKVSHEEGLQFVIQELELAVKELPSTYGKEDWGRITREAAAAFKSRVLLWGASPLVNTGDEAAKWKLAADAAQGVMESKAFELKKDYAAVFVNKNIMDKPEVILEFRYNGIKGEKMHAYDQNNTPAGYGGKGINCPTQDIVDSYEMANGLRIEEAGSGYDPANPYKNRDPRFAKSILFNGADFKDRAVETFTGGKDLPRTNPTPTGYYIRKFMDEKFDFNKDKNFGSSTNWVIMRYGEVLLNFAEATNEADGPSVAVYDAVNAIRKRVGMPAIPNGLNKEQMRDRIRHERRIELAFEDDIRYQDLKRWKLATDILNKSVKGVTITKGTNGVISYKEKNAGSRAFEERNYWFPIPLVEMGVNPNLKPQNPGW